MKRLVRFAAFSALLLVAYPRPAPSEAQTVTRQTAQAQERIYGSELMSERERLEYRERMRRARNEQERERLRSEHHNRMTVRARERGVILQDQGGRGDTGPRRGSAGHGRQGR